MNIFEAIEFHNEQVDKMQDLAEALMAAYPNVEDTPVDKAFGEAFSSLIPMAILLCCEANSEDPDGKWCTSTSWHVMPDDAFDKEDNEESN